MTKFGLLTYLSDAGTNPHGKKLWLMQCECGQKTTVIATHVRSGRTKSCGHLKSAGNRKTHGNHGTKLYTAWCNMKARCDNVSHKQYKDYGGRGISYDPMWVEFEPFAASVGAPPTNKHTLDRIDNNQNYTPDNVRWAVRNTQARNTRQNVWVNINGDTKCLHDWCEEYNIAAGSVYRRVNQGMDIVTAITTPKKRRNITHGISSRR